MSYGLFVSVAVVTDKHLGEVGSILVSLERPNPLKVAGQRVRMRVHAW